MNIIILRVLLLTGVLGRSLGQEVSSPLTADEEPLTSFGCPSPCVDTEFCGRDLQCHPYSCEAWYELGHPFFTAYVPGTSEDLTCSDVVEDRTFLRQPPFCEAGLPLAAEYIAPNASTTTCFDPSRDEQLATYSFTRKCTAQPISETGFICYDISPNTDFDTHTKEYVEQTQALNSGDHVYKLYVDGYTMRKEDGYEYPSYVGQILSLGEGGDGSVYNATAARAAMHARAFQTFDSPLPLDLCTKGCLMNEFCGVDGQCHAIDCDNFWEYGAVEFTGNDNDSKLNCTLELQESALNCDGEWPFALEYRCNEENVISSRYHVCPRGNGARQLPFYRMCTAQPNPSQEFVCFDLKGAGSMEEYAADYIQSTMDKPECTDAELDSFSWDGTNRDDIDWVAYHHQTHRTRNDGYSTSLYFRAPYDRASEEESLDLDSLEHAMFTGLVGAAPGSLEEGESASAASLMKTGGIAFRFLALMACILGI